MFSVLFPASLSPIIQSSYIHLKCLLFPTLDLGEDGEQIAAVLPGREEVSVAVLSSWGDSKETGHSSLSEADSLDDSRASKAEERRPMWIMKGLR